MPSPTPRYVKGDKVLYGGLTHDVIKGELRNGEWWYKLRYHLNLFGGTWVQGHDSRLRSF